jgi:hypothetical protein
MKRSWIATALTVVALGMGPLPVWAEGDSDESRGTTVGRVNELDAAARTFRVGDVDYYVPPGVLGLGHMSVGSVVSVEYEEGEDHRVASTIQAMD